MQTKNHCRYGHMFVASAHEGDTLRAEAVFVSDHHKIPSVEVRVTNQNDVLICHVTGMGYRKHVPLPEDLRGH